MKRALRHFWKDEDGGAVIEWALLVMFVTTFSLYTSASTLSGVERYAQHLTKQILQVDSPFMAR